MLKALEYCCNHIHVVITDTVEYLWWSFIVGNCLSLAFAFPCPHLEPGGCMLLTEKPFCWVLIGLIHFKRLDNCDISIWLHFANSFRDPFPFHTRGNKAGAWTMSQILFSGNMGVFLGLYYKNVSKA